MKKKLIKTIVCLSSLLAVNGMIISCNDNTAGGTTVNRSYSGEGAPIEGLGIDGDTYTDTLTGNMYKKENGTWVLVINSSPKSYTGEGEPNPELGNNGDKYTNNINGAEYEKQNGTWVLVKAGDTTYVVTFNLNGGHFANGDTTYPNQVVREGRWITAPASNPIKEHCTFTGWFAQGSTVAWNFIGQSVYGNVDLVAQYSVNEGDKINVTVNPNNGEASYQYETFVGDYYYPSVPEKDGYNFLGWYIAGTDTKYSGRVDGTLNNQTLEARWEKAKFNIQYVIEANNEVTVTGILDINSVAVSIPNEINGRKVTKISSKAFNLKTELKTVSIPENVKVIEEGAFRGARALQTVNVASSNLNYMSINGVLYNKAQTSLELFPTKAGTEYDCLPTLKRIGGYAFYDSKDSGISRITFNEGLEEIGCYAFAYNELIKSVDFPSTLKVIGKGAFIGSTTSGEDDSFVSPQGVLQNVSFNEGLEEIGEMAFANQYFKDVFRLPSTVKTLRSYAFANCNAITKIIFPQSLETLENNVFAGATGVLDLAVAEGNTHFKVIDKVLYNIDGTKLIMCPSGRTEPITIPEGVTELGDYAFYMVDELKEYTFPSTLTKIGVECFAQTYGLNSMVIPNSVTEIGHDCFYESGISSITLGTGLVEIPEAMLNATKISSIVIPSNVKKIGKYAFEGSPLSAVTFNEGLEEIGDAAFHRCPITTIDLPNSLKTIGASAFSGCKITNLDIKDGLTTIGQQAFSDSNGKTTLNTITVSAGNTSYSVVNNVLLSKDGTTLYMATSTAGEMNGDKYKMTIPNGVQVISDYAFAYCQNINEFVFSNTVTEIGEGAFMYTKVAQYDLPNSLKTIKDGAFYFTYAKAVNFGSGLETIGDFAFRMSDITALVLPNNIKSVGEGAFTQCMSLKSLALGSGIQTIGDFAFADTGITGMVTIPATCTSIGKGAFASTVSTYGQTISAFVVDEANPNYTSNGGLVMNKAQTTVVATAAGVGSITIPETVTEIRDYAMAANKLAVISLTLPSSLTRIGDCGLAFLTRVTSVNIPSSVTYIGDKVFAYWGKNQIINFSCTMDYALTNFHANYLAGCLATVNYTK